MLIWGHSYPITGMKAFITAMNQVFISWIQVLTVHTYTHLYKTDKFYAAGCVVLHSVRLCSVESEQFGCVGGLQDVKEGVWRVCRM